MGWRSGVLASCLVLGCGKTASKDTASGETTDGATDTGSGGTTSTASVSVSASVSASANTSVTTTGAALSCTFPEDRECGGECVDQRTDPEHCGGCSGVCTDEQECVQARCVSRLTCDQVETHYDPEDMQASGGTELEDGWALTVGETLSVEHGFQPGPALLLLTARRAEGELRPEVTLTIGDESIGPLLLAAASHATYTIEYEAAGREVVSISVSPAPGSDPDVVAVFQSLEIRDCAGLYGQCEGGGYYLPEMRTCAPAICSEASDCERDFVGPSFLGRCIDGVCEYPSCTETSASGLPLHEEYEGLATRVECVSYSELTFPHNNPRVESLAGDPEDFTCPAIETITWEVERFRGESSCVQVPICGPNAAEVFGFEPSVGECCYLVSWWCGA